MNRTFFYLLIAFLCLKFGFASAQKQKTKNKLQTEIISKGQVWSAEKANQWYAQHKWINGANYIPYNAINQLEMWQADTFDPSRIDQELGWAEAIGFNTMRIFLHSLAWKQDPEGFIGRVDKYLEIANKHKIQTIIVFFDDCWNKEAQIGKQPTPKPGVHNSGWLQDPGIRQNKDESIFTELEKYVKDVMGHFSKDQRILFWDLYNEPGNRGKENASLPLLQAVFSWARDVNPDQPVTVGLWQWSFEELNKSQIENSDIISYHNYEEPANHKRVVQILKSFGKPLICSEYMARPKNSRFFNIMPLLKQENVGAINWGFVAGKTNTQYAWDIPLIDGREPDEWFHEIFLPDGTPYSIGEVNLIKRLNGK
jgi:hypothetical protein